MRLTVAREKIQRALPPKWRRTMRTGSGLPDGPGMRAISSVPRGRPSSARPAGERGQRVEIDPDVAVEHRGEPSGQLGAARPSAPRCAGRGSERPRRSARCGSARGTARPTRAASPARPLLLHVIGRRGGRLFGCAQAAEPAARRDPARTMPRPIHGRPAPDRGQSPFDLQARAIVALSAIAARNTTSGRPPARGLTRADQRCGTRLAGRSARLAAALRPRARRGAGRGPEGRRPRTACRAPLRPARPLRPAPRRRRTR